MTIRVDPQGNEIGLMKTIGSWRDKKVIEIGCGDGRLTQRIAHLGPKLIQAIDPDPSLISTARKTLPEAFAKQIRYKTGTAEDLKYPPEAFNIAVFSWVL